MNIRKFKKFKQSTTQTILLSFFLAIIAGSILLSLPISTADGKGIPYIDALFTSTTSICVTGLVTVSTVNTWSIFGQAVILLLIQIGGLGIITIMSGFMILLNQKINMKDRLLIQDAFNLNTLSGIVKFVKKVLKGTFIIEGTGALLYMTVFIPDFGLKGIWISIFNSISAFCNAGIDIIGDDSLCRYVHNPIINLTTAFLIISGGIGYIVWWDLLRVLPNIKSQKSKCFRKLTLHSKIAITTSVILIFSGTILYLIFEYNNPATIKDFNIFEKIQASFFQSVTTRTAGFATIPQQNFTNESSLVTLILMFIGGSPVGTAGGVKTVTVAVLAATTLSIIRNQDYTVLFQRTISKEAINKSIAVISVAFTVLFISTLLLSAVIEADIIDIMFETVSATATVGLSRNLTSSLNLLGKIIIIFTMYLGRVGPISFAIILNMKNTHKKYVKDPTEDISVG